MDVVFITQKADTPWLPTVEKRAEFEDFLESKIDHKVIFLPQGCVPCMQEIGGETLVLIEQHSMAAKVSEEAQKEVIDEIREKIGNRAFFLPPACNLSVITLGGNGIA